MKSTADNWGRIRRNFYGSSYVDKDFGGIVNSEDEECLCLEEEEAIARQKRLDFNNLKIDYKAFSHSQYTNVDDIEKPWEDLKRKLASKHLEGSTKNNSNDSLHSESLKQQEEIEPCANIDLHSINPNHKNCFRRKITYEIRKNRGKVKKSKKDLTHSRVRKRKQYHNALIHRRSQVPDVRFELNKYDGEKRGIRCGTIRSIKF